MDRSHSNREEEEVAELRERQNLLKKAKASPLTCLQQR
jgi:hypothetical protein